MTTRTLKTDDGVVRRYQVKNDAGDVIGEDIEPSPGSSLANQAAIYDAARQALGTNRNYVATASPTAAQTTAQVKALARQQNGIIRLLLNALDATD